jgi:hypothetical protein
MTQGEVESNLASMAFPPLVEPAASLSAREVERYARHVLIPDLGMEGRRWTTWTFARGRLLLAGVLRVELSRGSVTSIPPSRATEPAG